MGSAAVSKDLRDSKTFCEGVTAQKNSVLRASNPYPTGQDQERLYWDMGWFYADQTLTNEVDLSVCGYPAVGKLPWETSGVAYVPL